MPFSKTQGNNCFDPRPCSKLVLKEMSDVQVFFLLILALERGFQKNLKLVFKILKLVFQIPKLPCPAFSLQEMGWIPHKKSPFWLINVGFHFDALKNLSKIY